MPFGQYSNGGASKWGATPSSSGGSSSKWGTVPTKKKKEEEDLYDTSKIQKSIDNAELRIKDAGGVLNQDKRNEVEKFLNLPEDQNWLFDTLDIIGRPQQAVYNTVKGIVDNDQNPFERGKEGFKGQRRITGSDFIGDMGIDNKYAKAGLGFALDVVADPINLIPGGVIVKGAKLASKGATIPLKAGLDVAESTFPKLKDFRELKVEPKLDAVKDGLGSMFKYQYGWDKTLSGGTKDDTLKNLYNQTENDIRYMSENSLRDVTKAAKESGGVKTGEDVGRLMEKDVQVYGPRPYRQHSTDPKVIKAADDLIKSNDTLRQWAIDNDIPVGEIDGFMRHILSTEEKALRKTRQGKLIDTPRSGMNNPDKGVLKSRKLQGSVEDINQEIGRKFFDPNAYFSTAVGQKKLIEYGNAVKFRREILDNPNFAQKSQPGQATPHGSEKINLNNYQFLNNPANALPDAIGGEYIVTRGLKQALDRYQKLSTDEGINTFLKAVDTGMSWWKRGTLLSLPYHLRNDIGAKFNNYLAGMNLPDMTKYSSLALKDVTNALARGKETPMYDEFRRQGLSSTSQMAIDFAKHGADPEKALSKVVKDQSRNKLQKAGDMINPLKIFDTSQKLGNVVDQTNRFALYRWGREAKNMSPEDAAALVRETQFDYSRVTKTEKEVFSRLAPFYRWSRNNIPFQLRKFAENPARYTHINKLRTNLQDSMGLDDKDTPDYLRENFFMPVTNNGDGTGKLFGANLPVGDLTKLSSPGKLGMDNLSPAIKLPIELTSNRSLFFNNDIERFEGQEKKYVVPDNFFGMELPKAGEKIGGLPVKIAYAIEQLGGQPVRGFSKYISEPTVQEQENKALMPGLGISSLLKDYNIKDSNLKEKKRELRELMDYLDYLEQEQGKRARSVNEIKKKTK